MFIFPPFEEPRRVEGKGSRIYLIVKMYVSERVREEITVSDGLVGEQHVAPDVPSQRCSRHGETHRFLDDGIQYRHFLFPGVERNGRKAAMNGVRRVAVVEQQGSDLVGDFFFPFQFVPKIDDGPTNYPRKKLPPGGFVWVRTSHTVHARVNHTCKDDSQGILKSNTI